MCSEDDRDPLIPGGTVPLGPDRWGVSQAGADEGVPLPDTLHQPVTEIFFSLIVGIIALSADDFPKSCTLPGLPFVNVNRTVGICMQGWTGKTGGLDTSQFPMGPDARYACITRNNAS